MTDKKIIIRYFTHQHPTEGLLIELEYFADDPRSFRDGWSRCKRVDIEGGDTKPTTPEEYVRSEYSIKDLEIQDGGAATDVPDFRVDVCGSFEDAQGEIQEDGISITWGGACPVQGYGVVDGRPVYYRARGHQWSFEVGTEGTAEFDHEVDAEFTYEEHPYIWPDGGWITAEESERNIRIGVAAWRKRGASRGDDGPPPEDG